MPGNVSCCICASQYQHCTNCDCARNNRSCVGCRKGNNCRNPHGRDERQGAAVDIVGAPLPDDILNDSSESIQSENTVPTIVAPTLADVLEVNDGQRQQWNGMSMENADIWVKKIYSEVVRWSPGNLFEPPKCAASKEMIREMTRLINNYSHDSPLAPLAIQILAIIPHLFCQRTHARTKHRENVAAMKRRLTMWQNGALDDLLSEARTLQERLKFSGDGNQNTDDVARKFGNKMREGKVSLAVRSLTEESSRGVLPINRETIQQLKNKHPPASGEEGIRFQGNYIPPNAVMFEKITGGMVWKKALKTQGGAGPSGLDANGWRVILSTNKFGAVASDLCNAIAALARKLATSCCYHLHALTACRLIPLDKNPGCRPIGVGEVLRRIIGKCIMDVVNDDVRAAAGNLQVCAGHQAGGEAAIHAMRTIFEQRDSEAVLLVDASNAFNLINRKATLHNIKIKCPSFAMFVENTYRNPSDLYITSIKALRGDTIIQSMEGTTQGDPVAMAMYALGLSVLQQTIDFEKTAVKQVAYADDLTGAGKVEDIKKWWDLITSRGPQIGYHPNASKSFLIVKPEHYDRAVEVFGGSEVKITKDGQRHLGAVIGTKDFKTEYVTGKVNEWVREIQALSDIANTEPHAAFAAYTHGVKHRWNYLMRTIPDIGPLLHPLEDAISVNFIPKLVKHLYLSPAERSLLALPPRLGGMGLTNPEEIAATEHQNSVKLTAALTDHIIAQNATGEVDTGEINKIRRSITTERQHAQRDRLQQLMSQVPENLKKKITIAQEVGASNWLTTLPIKAKGFSLNKQEFTDAIALRYGKPVEGLPSQCVCGLSYDIDHAMVCKKGGFVCMRHDEVRDLTANLLKEICHDVMVEPPLLPLDGENFRHRTSNISNEARVDVSARGFWTRGQRAFFDIRIFDPMAACHRNLALDAAHRRNENDKIRAYGERIQNVDQGSFTPLVFTSSGGMGPRARCFYARLAEVISERKQQPRSYVTAWLRCRLSFSLLRSALLCLRGTRASAPMPTTVADIDYEATVTECRIDLRLN